MLSGRQMDRPIHRHPVKDTLMKYISAQFLQMNITNDTVGATVSNLTATILATVEISDQNSGNLAVVESVFSETAALLERPETTVSQETRRNVC